MTEEIVVECEITDRDIFDMPTHIPLAISIRQKLSVAGFKFEDDGKLSSINNENPVALGEIKMRKDVMSGTIYYKQTLNKRLTLPEEDAIIDTSNEKGE